MVDKVAPKINATPEHTKPLTLAQGIGALPEASPISEPLAAQLGNAFYGIQHLGVTKDRRAFALRVTVDDFYGEDGGGSSKFSLRLVYDTWTGLAIAAFRDRGDLGQHAGGKYGKERFSRYKQVWEAAGDRAGWAAWRREHGLKPVAAAREPKEGGHFELRLDAKAMRRFSVGSLESSEQRKGFDVQWEQFYEPIQAAVAAGSRAKPRLPNMELSFVSAEGHKREQLTFAPRLGEYAMSGEPRARITLSFRTHLDAKTGRAFWIHTVKTRAIEIEAHPPWGRFYVRSTAPFQVKIVAAGSGMASARRVAALFEKLGVTVTQVEEGERPTPISTVYYRGAAIELAKKIQSFMPGIMPVSELSSSGWVDVIVVLGADAAIAP